MNEEMLSQDQIDALSSGAALGEIGGDKTASDGSFANKAGLSKAFELLAAQATTVLSTVVGREVRTTLVECAPASADQAKEEFSKGYLLLTVVFSKGFPAPLYFCISKKDTAILADLMMMGDGAAEYEEDHKDAIGELVNQIMGAVSTAFGVQFNMECAVTPVTTQDFNPAASDIAFSEAQRVKMGLALQGLADSSFTIFVPNKLAEPLAEKAANLGSGLSASDAPSAGAAAAAMSAGSGAGLGGAPAQFGSFGAPVGFQAQSLSMAATTPGNINMLLDIQLQVAIELGRTEMSIKRILELGPGSILELDRMAGEPVDLLVNGKVVAKGEVVVVDENFGIRVVSLVSPEERLKSLK